MDKNSFSSFCTSDETPCKYHVEVSASACQQFERYLIQKRLSYRKLECVRHTEDNEELTRWSESNDNEGTAGQFDQSRINYLSNCLKTWFRDHDTTSLEEFSEQILSQSPMFLSSMVNMRLVPTMIFEEEIWSKIENFLGDEIQQEEFLSSSGKKGTNIFLMHIIYIF